MSTCTISPAKKMVLAKALTTLCVFSFNNSYAASEFPEYNGPCRQRDAVGKCEIPIVSLINLFATPERFHNRKVEFRGTAWIEFEHVAIAFPRNSGAAGSIWLEYNNEAIHNKADADRALRRFRDWQTKYSGKSVIVQGIFDMTDKGHGGMYPGALHTISRIEVVKPGG